MDAFTAKCGDYERLTWDKYTAHKRLAEYAQAGDAAGKLMELNPLDFDYPWWRAEMLAEQGKLEEAVVDYRLALSLEPRMRIIPTMLADTLFKLGRPCEARGPLEQLIYFHPEQRTASGIATRLGKVDEAHCEATTAEGGAVFTLPKGGSAITARVKVNGKALGTFIVDTGATSVVLSKAFAAKAGVDGPSRTVKIRTAAGIREGQLTTLALVEAQGTKARNVEAVISDGLTDDGLLGLSYLTRFDVFFDSRSNTLTLKPLAKPKP
ncbi:MAG: TIGR02281 family clan AA aspartic protease [Myxococcaceae bacterium]|nr:TIGR02281 family clan AA aspartic protease [Myxococcaceae bacterium]